MIRKAADLKPKDLYRTPMSGGHAQHFKGDLTLSFKAHRVFPFIVECKHRANWKPLMMFEITKDASGYFQQVTIAQSKEEEVLRMVVMRGNATKIFAAVAVKEISEERDYKSLLSSKYPGIHFRVDNEEWKMLLFTKLLKVVTRIAKRREEKRKKT